MHLTRRRFGLLLGIAPMALPSAQAKAPAHAAIIERRTYDRAGAVPPEVVLRRCGLILVRRENAGEHVELTISSPSLAERAQAWDRFNSDPEWCALRELREVRLRGIAIEPASATA